MRVCVRACVRVCVCVSKQNKKCSHTVHFCLPLIIYTINIKKEGGGEVDVSIQCLTHVPNTISLHYDTKMYCFSIWYKAF